MSGRGQARWLAPDWTASASELGTSRLRRGEVIRRTAALVIACLCVIACAQGAVSTPAAASPAPASASPPPPTAAPSISVAPSGPAFVVVGTEPVIPSDDVPDSGAVLPAAVAAVDGTYHAWIKGFGSVPGEHGLFHLRSADAVTWTLDPAGPIESSGVVLADVGVIPGSVVVIDGRWTMYLSGTQSTAGGRADVWRATADEPGGPWTIDADPVLVRGPAGAWDDAGLDFPSVLPTVEGFVMAYQGLTAADPNSSAVGLATSLDGVEWTKLDQPILEPGFCGEFDARAIAQPRLLHDGDRLLLAYTAYARAISQNATIGLAESVDGGATWRCLSTEPALESAGFPSGGLHTFALFERDGEPTALVEWLADNGTDIWLTELVD